MLPTYRPFCASRALPLAHSGSCSPSGTRGTAPTSRSAHRRRVGPIKALLQRRGFLRGLVSLPLIGGGVTLIGSPTAAAVPVTKELLDSYDAWLFYERRYLHFERYGSANRAELAKDEWMLTNTRTGEAFDWVSVDNAGGRYHGKPDHGPS